uniref:DNA replication complex GINS protein PSF1 n=1 Tax=Phlebotomus papatasi TaxID=29031 RepID=A0A1B0D174_PHLPP
MLGVKSLELVKDLSRNPDSIPTFRDDTIREVLVETQEIFNANSRDARICSSTNNQQLLPILSFRHAALERNKRCMLAYLYNRLERIRNIRWETGPTIPEHIKTNLCEPEIQWFNGYNKLLAKYMKSVGDGQGIDLTCDMEPPKSLYIEVRCLEDYGKFELEDGELGFFVLFIDFTDIAIEWSNQVTPVTPMDYRHLPLKSLRIASLGVAEAPEDQNRCLARHNIVKSNAIQILT